MKYAETGKGSEAWWIEQVKLHGKDSIRVILRGSNMPVHQIRAALQDLETSGYVYAEGVGGKGRVQTFHVSQAGERFLANNGEDISDSPVLPLPTAKAPASYTWKRVMGGGVRYFMDGKMVPTNDIPDDELHRMQAEIKHGGAGTVEPEKPAQRTHNGADVYTWQKPIAAPVRYFRNGDFILQTEIPAAELERMQSEHSPAPSKPIEHRPVPAVPHFTGPPLPKQLEKDLITDEERSMGAALGLTPEQVAEAKADMGDLPADKFRTEHTAAADTNEFHGLVQETPAERTAKGIAIAKHVATNGGVPVDDTQRPIDRVVEKAVGLGQAIEKHHQQTFKPSAEPVVSVDLPARAPEKPAGDIVRRDDNPDGASLNTSQPGNNAAPAAREMFDQPDVAALMREAMSEILFERFADTLTATEVLERLKAKAES